MSDDDDRTSVNDEEEEEDTDEETQYEESDSDSTSTESDTERDDEGRAVDYHGMNPPAARSYSQALGNFMTNFDTLVRMARRAYDFSDTARYHAIIGFLNNVQDFLDDRFFTPKFLQRSDGAACIIDVALYDKNYATLDSAPARTVANQLISSVELLWNAAHDVQRNHPVQLIIREGRPDLWTYEKLILYVEHHEHGNRMRQIADHIQGTRTADRKKSKKTKKADRGDDGASAAGKKEEDE